MEDINKLGQINVNGTAGKEEESSFNWRAIYSMFILNWHWFAISVFIFVCGALLYVKYKSPVYSVSVKMLIKDDDNKTMQRGRGNQMLANMQDLGFITNSNGIDNEVEILQSHILAEEAVKNLKLYTEYKVKQRIKSRLIYKAQPVNVDLDPKSLQEMDETMLPVKLTITKEGRTYKVEGTCYDQDAVMHGGTPEALPISMTINALPATLHTKAGTLTFTRNYDSKARMLKNNQTIEVTINSPKIVAASYVGSMTVEPTSKTTSIALITIKDKNVDRAEDYLKELSVCYNQQANADKNEIAMKTEEFINGRLEKINGELGMTESELENYKRRNNLTELKLDATQTLTQTSQYSSLLADAKSQIQLLDFLREYVDNPKNKYQIIPSNVGLKDPSSTELISSYNKAVLERNRLLRSASELSPQVATLTSTVNDLENSIKVALSQARRSADIQMQSIENQYSMYRNRVSNTPQQERILTQIGRQQEVKSGLYLMLLQKREENSISLAATADKGELIDEPSFGGKVSPKNSVIILGAIVVGIGLPLGILYLLSMMRYKIEGHEDVVKLTNAPVVADVAVASENAKSAADIVVHENRNDQIDEIFRSMRTNIQFMLKEKQNVIMFTSSTTGEGKTFNSANLAVSFALLGKKVILVGLDIRRPALGKLFGLSDLTLGVTPLLTRNTLSPEAIRSQIQPSGVNPNLDLMLAGPIPPNPTELLARQNLKDVIDYLREAYDYVILDTAPVLLVSDTLQIDRHADVTVYVCRADYTPKSDLEMLNQLIAEKKLTNVCVVLNGVDMSLKKYGYYYGYGKYGKYGHYGKYSSYTSYGSYSNSNYGHKDDNSIKR